MIFKFLHHMKFDPVDPLDDGLKEEIEAEKKEPDAIVLEDTIDESSLDSYLNQVVEEEEA